MLVLLGLVLAAGAGEAPPILVSATAHSYAFPFQRPVTLPLQPGLEVGTELTHLERGAWHLVQLVDLGLYDTGDLTRGVYADTHLAGRWAAPWGALADVSLGAGYLHRFHARETLVLRDGLWVAARDPGRPSVMFGFGLGVGHRVPVREAHLRVFARYRWFGHLPYLMPVAPFMAHSLLGIGVGVEL